MKKIKEFIEVFRKGEIATPDEASVKQRIILQLLALLDWNIFNEVIPEYSVGGKRVDYCIKAGNNKKIFIEVKNINQDLSNIDHQEQLLNYAFREGVKLAILTNGISWEFYLPLTEGSWEQRKFYTIDIMQQDVEEVSKNFYNFLAKENIISDKSTEIAKSYLDVKLKQKVIEANLYNAWNKLITEKDELLIEIINDALEKICGFRAENQKIIDFIQSNQNNFIISANIDKKLQVNRGEVNLEFGGRNTKDSGYIRTGFTTKNIRSFIFNGISYNVDSWVGLLLKISEILYLEKQNSFNIVESIRGRKRKYYSKNKNEIYQPCKIGKTEYFVDTNLGANSIVNLVTKVLGLLGYSKNLLEIITD